MSEVSIEQAANNWAGSVYPNFMPDTATRRQAVKAFTAGATWELEKENARNWDKLQTEIVSVDPLIVNWEGRTKLVQKTVHNHGYDPTCYEVPLKNDMIIGECLLPDALPEIKDYKDPRLKVGAKITVSNTVTIGSEANLRNGVASIDQVRYSLENGAFIELVKEAPVDPDEALTESLNKTLKEMGAKNWDPEDLKEFISVMRENHIKIELEASNE